jgi:hypothetical protein
MNTRFLLRTLCLVIGLSVGQFASAAPLFVGQFDVSNFVLNTMGGNGSVDSSLAPASIVLFGHDDIGDEGPDGPVVTTFLTTVASDTAFSFYWLFDTNDDDASYDPFGYSLNGSLYQLTDDDLSQQGGFATVNLVAGDVFGFFTDATDNCCGGSATMISGDPISAVPEPSSALLLLGGLGALATLHRRRAS